MIQGLYAAATGLMAIEDRLSVISNNIANATTPGFKRQLAVQRGYYQAFLAKPQNVAQLDMFRAPGGGIKTTQTFASLSNGIITSTGNPLDVALDGPGFIRVSTPDGVQYTRSGHFSVGESGQLITAHGYDVLGTDGQALDVSGGVVEIDSQGYINVDGQLRGQISVYEFEDPQALERVGYTLFRASDSARAQGAPAEHTTIAAGSIENSNVQLPIEMADMTMALRAYAANQRVISAIDETMSRLINQVGSPS